MKLPRRQFLQLGLAGGALAPVWNGLPPVADDRLLRECVAANDRRISQLLAEQTRAPYGPGTERFVGGFPNRDRIHNPGRAASCVKTLVAGYVAADSDHFQSAEVQRSLELAIDYLRRVQHADGTIDLVTTNFHSPPDTAFAVEPLALAVAMLRRHAPERLIRFRERTMEFLERAGAALAVGGIHTPNHRWVICMALAWLQHLAPHPRYVRRIDRWLAEKIDIDADGQYTERSAAVYTPLVNRCLITMARLLSRPELYEPVRKSLDMTFYFVRPTGEIVTEASRRQDQYRVARIARYHYPFRFMALRDRRGDYAGMADWIETISEPAELLRTLPHWLVEPELSEPLPPGNPLPTDYEKRFPGSQLVRIRRGNRDLTILAENDRLLTYHHGRAALQAVRVASAFFGKGQFVGRALEPIEGGYRLRQQLRGPYYQPLPTEQLPDDGDWSRMPRDQRPQSEVQTLESVVEVRERAAEVGLRIQIDGTDHVPVAIELSFRPGGELQQVEALDAPQTHLLREGFGRYVVEGDTIEFGPGRAGHRWTDLRGALPKLEGHSVYLTGFTPIDWELTLR